MIRKSIQCDNCGNNEHFDVEGWGKDEEGSYTIYVCEECSEQIIVNDDMEE